MAAFALLLVITCSIVKASWGITAYDCGLPQINLTSISLVSTPICTPDVDQTTSRKVRVAITQNRLTQDIKYMRCSVSTTNLLYRCGKTIDTFHDGGIFSDEIKVSREECQDIVNKGIYRMFTANGAIDITIKAGVTKVSVTTRGEIRGGSCTPGNSLERNGRFYDRPVVQTEIVVRYSTGIGIADIEDKTIAIESIKFPISQEQGVDADLGHIFWKIPTPDCSGQDSKSLVYEGVAELVQDNSNGHQLVQVTHSGYDFQILIENKTTYICGLLSHYTEHPKLFLTLLSEDQPSMRIESKVGPRDVNMLNYINSKIVYAFRHIRANVIDLYRMFKNDRCQTNNRITKNLMTLALLSPKEFAFAYGGPGCTAVTRGEVVYLAKCPPVSVLPNRAEKGCFNELPVSYKNSSYFMSPRSRILLKVGTPVDCLADMRPKYRLNDKWFYNTPDGLSETIPPKTISVEPLNFEFVDSIKVREGMYDSDLVEKYQRTIISPVVRDIITTRVVNAISGDNALPDGYQLSYAFNPVDYGKIKETVGGFWSSFSDKAKDSGSWFGFFIMIFAVYKCIVYTLGCLLNFRELKREVGCLLAIPLCLVEAITNLVLHNRILKSFRQPKPDAEEEEMEDLKATDPPTVVIHNL
ncbi:putative glycoprotein [Bolahun virus]|uniref:Putative glycoprotein n=1 Tax=Bolahun virus TaxID=2661622 RepID=A0A1C9U5H2_9MONO|nr:putative glycoprotein [Bolahun virus variant 2]AOR51373.1 putative glycoprotein [Bolahun virus variant 2]